MSLGNPIFRLGLISDVQYADLPNGHNFARTKQRFYRESRLSLREAIKCFDEHQVAAICHLGDLLDGQCHNSSPEKLYSEILSEFPSEYPVLHCLGNHDLTCLPKESLSQLLNLPQSYYTYTPSPGWKVIVLDTYDFSCFHQETREEAFRYLKERNPNDFFRPGVDWIANVDGLDKRFVPYNGGLSSSQLRWLERELDCSDDVLIFSHIPLSPHAACVDALVWNYDDVLSLIRHGRARVRAVFSGHDHDGGYFCSSLPSPVIHFVTLSSPMTCRNYGHDVAHAVVEVHDDRIEVKGYGNVPTRTLQFPTTLVHTD
jgi:manganese-dependent ADP-ribose/CDP-alcohol diphosphatase